MKTLHALLRASPRCFQVYRTCRAMVLSHVGWNHITPAVVPIALDALEMRENRKFQRDRAKTFLSQKTLKEPHEIPFSTWERLLSFHEIVDSFISGFTNSRLVALEDSLPESLTSLSSQNISPSTHLSLSQLEYSRLARAFYNLERYGNLFHDLDTSRGAIHKRATTFLGSLRDWELEELLCVRSYMIERLEDYLNKFENNFMEAFKKEMPYINWPLQDTREWTDVAELLSEEGYYWSQCTWIESCLTRGIETLSKILSTDTFQAGLCNLWAWQTRGNYINQVLTQMSERPSCSEQELAVKMKSPEIGFYDNIEQPNEAWYWSMKSRGHPRIAIPRDIIRTWISEGLDTDNWDCCWGYVIWTMSD